MIEVFQLFSTTWKSLNENRFSILIVSQAVHNKIRHNFLNCETKETVIITQKYTLLEYINATKQVILEHGLPEYINHLNLTMYQSIVLHH